MVVFGWFDLSFLLKVISYEDELLWMLFLEVGGKFDDSEIEVL